MNETPPIRRLQVVLIVVAHFAVALRFLLEDAPGTAAALTGFPLDDAWIHLVYGRELAMSGLPAYNPGEPEAGFSSPLWMFVAAAAEALHALASVSPVVMLKAFGVASGIAASLAVRRVAWTVSGNAWAALAAALLVALSPAMAFTQVAGMEAGLTGALIALSLHAMLAGRFRQAGLLGGAAYLARPEAAVATVVCVAAIAAEGLVRGRFREAATRAAAVALPVAAAAGLWVAYCLAVTGHPLPNTFYVKATAGDLGPGIVTILREIVAAEPAGAAGALLYLGGTVLLLARRRDAGAWALAALPWALLAAVAASRSMPEGNGAYYYWQRYAVPALPLLFPPMAVALAGLAGAARDAGGPAWRRVAGPAAAGVLCLAAAAGYPARIAAQAEQFAWNCQNINEVQVAIGHWVRQRVAPDRAVATTDAGAVRYFGGRRTLDLVGLNSREVAFDPELAAIRLDPRVTAAWMDRAGADVLVIFPALTRLIYERHANELFGLVETFRSPHYTVVPAPQDVMAVFARRPAPDPSAAPANP